MELPVADRITASSSRSIPYITGILDDFFYTTGSDLALLFSVDSQGYPEFLGSKSIFEISLEQLNDYQEWLDFVLECRQVIIQNCRERTLFPALFYNCKMQSSLVYPLIPRGEEFYALILNSLNKDHYGNQILRKTELQAVRTIEKLEKILQDGNNGQNRESQE